MALLHDATEWYMAGRTVLMTISTVSRAERCFCKMTAVAPSSCLQPQAAQGATIPNAQPWFLNSPFGLLLHDVHPIAVQAVTMHAVRPDTLAHPA